jgi:outer membrane protein W
MRRGMAAVIAVAWLGSASAYAGSLELRIGGFAPDAESTLFLDSEDLFTVQKEDWQGLTGGLEYSWNTGRHTELGLHLDGFGTKIHTTDRHFRRASGGEIRQTLELHTAPLGMTFRYVFGGRHARLRPYLGIGADVVFWEYEEYGAFRDPVTDDIIEYDEFLADGAVPALHFNLGLRLAITPDISLTAEGKYLAAAEEEMKDDWIGLGNEIDVSGAAFTFGVHVRF